MTLHEMQQWLHEMEQSPPVTSAGERPQLRLVS